VRHGLLRLSILDVACGGGDVPVGVARQMNALGIEASLILTDRSLTALGIARRAAEEFQLSARCVLGHAPDVAGWHSIEAYPEAEQLPGIVVFRWEAPLFFANAGAFRQQVRHLVRENRPTWVVLQCEAITDIDVTAADMLRLLDDELNEEGVHLAFAEMRSRLQDLTLRYGLLETLDRDHFYPTLETALAAAQTGPPRPSEGVEP
jgi:MFS superfamily sulfate permease-like transporter